MVVRLLVVVLIGLAQGASTPPSQGPDVRVSPASDALVRGQYQQALTLAEQALAERPSDAWALYEKGCALVGLGRIDEAVATLREAESRFASDTPAGTDVAWAQGIATFRRAIALEQAGRCEEARAEFAHYTRIAQRTDPEAASMARSHATRCLPARERVPVSGHER